MKTLYVDDRKAWRAWLQKNFDTETEIWLVFPRKSAGKPAISYNDAVEEALCFGWIDSNVKKLDEMSSVQKFSRRKPHSRYSQPNKERLKWLAKHGMLHSSVTESVQEVLKEKFMFPPDIIEAVKSDREAWKHYRQFSDAYKRIRVAYIEAARTRPAEFKKRLSNFIEKTRLNKKIGYGGIDKHY